MTLLDLTLKHYPRKPEFVFDRAHDYSGSRVRSDKPTGFWVSVQGEDDWKSWCEGEEYALGTLQNEYDVTLAEDAKILLIDSAMDLALFSRAYDDTAKAFPALASDSAMAIDWDRLAEAYDGIIIAPYQWSARLSLSWYYGWDCASGCIWNLDAIASVTPSRLAVTR